MRSPPRRSANAYDWRSTACAHTRCARIFVVSIVSLLLRRPPPTATPLTHPCRLPPFHSCFLFFLFILPFPQPVTPVGPQIDREVAANAMESVRQWLKSAPDLSDPIATLASPHPAVTLNPLPSRSEVRSACLPLSFRCSLLRIS
eukprot:232745-Rhodomonas_salina.1